MKKRSFLDFFALFFFGLLPTIVLFVSIFATALATIVLDHDILGRDADGWPVLYKIPILRYAVDALHLGVMFGLPLVLAVSFFRRGQRANASTIWILIGGMLVCVLGGVTYLEAVWTGVKGTSDLRIGIVENSLAALARITVNVASYLWIIVIERKRIAKG